MVTSYYLCAVGLFLLCSWMVSLFAQERLIESVWEVLKRVGGTQTVYTGREERISFSSLSCFFFLDPFGCMLCVGFRAAL